MQKKLKIHNTMLNLARKTSLLRQVLAGMLLCVIMSESAQAQIVDPSSYESLRQSTQHKIKNKIEPLLTRYCGDACQIIRSELEILESISEVEDLGFESVSEDEGKNSFYVNRARITVEVDGRVTTQNRKRLENILINHLASFGFGVKIEWAMIELPRIGQSIGAKEKLKTKLDQKVRRAIQKTIDRYCPDRCLISRIDIVGEIIYPDEAESLASNQVVKIAANNSIFKIDSVNVDVEVDSSIEGEERKKILNVMEAKTRFVNPIDIRLNAVDFPETHLSKQKKLSAESQDPYGLEKLRRMLVMFRDLAGTKEVITTNSSSSQSSESKNQNSVTNSKLSSATSGSDLSGSWIDGVPNWVLIVGAVVFFLVLALGFAMRIGNANKDAKYMMQAAGLPAQQNEEYAESHSDGKKDEDQDDTAYELSLKLKNDGLKEELIEIFMNAPRVAKETFGRMLQEEGVETTSKYVHIFGHLIVFELLGDPNLSRDLFELSEYYHKSDYEFDTEEVFDLLMILRTKVTANRIKVLAKRTMDQFDFILKLDPTQIFNLVVEEKPSVQSIVLTQLDHKSRRTVFDMFEGDNKVSLMQELCRADAIPKEYLSNVAKALHKKVLAKPEFDAENLRSADILLDLLEKSSLDEQRALMVNLNETNHDAARAIKLKLVTIEMLPFLKGGHLLELILGLERDSLVTFLAGTNDVIKDLLLSHAPEELADSWLEDLETVITVDEGKYRLVEMQILSRIRNLASNGAINLLDINEMIFDSQGGVDESYEDEEISRDHFVA